jgi:hypothetical protein
MEVRCQFHAPVTFPQGWLHLNVSSYLIFRSQDNSVRIVTRLCAGIPGFDPQQGRICLFATKSRLALGPTQPSMQLAPEFFPRGKRPEREDDDTLHSSAEVNNVWSYNSTSPYVCMTWSLVEYQAQLYLCRNFTTSPPFVLSRGCFFTVF